MVTARGLLLLIFIAYVANAHDEPTKINIAPRRELENDYYEDTDEPVTPLPSKFCEDKSDGFYADIRSNCRRFHYCQTWTLPYGQRKVDWRFECPGTTLFNQEHLACVPEDIYKDCEDSEQWFDKNQTIPEFPPTDDGRPFPDIPGGSQPIPDYPEESQPTPDRPQRPKPTTERPSDRPPRPKPTTERPTDRPDRPQRPKPTTERPTTDAGPLPDIPQGSRPIPGLPGDSNIIPELPGKQPFPGYPNPSDLLSSLEGVKFPEVEDRDSVEIRNPELLPTIPPAQNVLLPTLQFRHIPYYILNPISPNLPQNEVYSLFQTIDKPPPLKLNFPKEVSTKKNDEKKSIDGKIAENLPLAKHEELTGYLPQYPPLIPKDFPPNFGIDGKPLAMEIKTGKDEGEMERENNLLKTEGKNEQPLPLPLLPVESNPVKTRIADKNSRPLLEISDERVKEDYNKIWGYYFKHENSGSPTRTSLYDSSLKYHSPIEYSGLFRHWDGNPLLFPTFSDEI